MLFACVVFVVCVWLLSLCVDDVLVSLFVSCCSVLDSGCCVCVYLLWAFRCYVGCCGCLCVWACVCCLGCVVLCCLESLLACVFCMCCLRFVGCVDVSHCLRVLLVLLSWLFVCCCYRLCCCCLCVLCGCWLCVGVIGLIVIDVCVLVCWSCCSCFVVVV